MKKTTKKKIDWSKAKAVQPRLGEVQEIISGKLRECLERQQNFVNSVLARIYTSTELQEIDKQLSNEGANITMKWYGTTYPVELLRVEREIKVHQLKEHMRQEVYLRKALENDGLSEQDLKDLVMGRYKKTSDALSKSEVKEGAK